MKVCKNCGTQNKDTSLFCEGCGTRLEEAPAVVTPVVEEPAATVVPPVAEPPVTEVPAHEPQVQPAFEEHQETGGRILRTDGADRDSAKCVSAAASAEYVPAACTAEHLSTAGL